MQTGDIVYILDSSQVKEEPITKVGTKYFYCGTYSFYKQKHADWYESANSCYNYKGFTSLEDYDKYTKRPVLINKVSRVWWGALPYDTIKKVVDIIEKE